jgi:general secretion pathway protein E
MTFAKALRAILRQDPDVVMIGEIRDLETAQIAVQASLTGHLVLATLHTNDSASAVTRLIDMGIEPFLLSSSLLGVLAQRLVRRLCVHCRREEVLELTPAEVEAVAGTPVADGVTPAAPARKSVWHHVGCERCGNSGYQGRTGVYELLTVTPEIQTMIHRQAPESEIKAFAIGQGMHTMRADAQRWIDTGVTSLEEVLRVTRD